MCSIDTTALEFCLTSPNAVILTLWPSGGEQCLEMAKTYLQKCSADIKFYTKIKIKKHAAVPVVRALYHGEERLESNCWYNEQPLDTGPPEGPHAGAKWKKELCFKGSLKEEEQDGYVLHIFVVDARNATSSLWTMKYSTRSAMAKKTGNPGNSCMHITDSQSRVIAGESGGNPGGYSCDDSFAFHCARTLLDKDSLSFLNTVCSSEKDMDKYWNKYTSWLSHSPSGSKKFPSEILSLK